MTAARLIYGFLKDFFLPPLLPSEVFTNEGDWSHAAKEEVGPNQSFASLSGLHLAAAADGSHRSVLDQTSLGKSVLVWSSLVWSSRDQSSPDSEAEPSPVQSPLAQFSLNIKTTDHQTSSRDRSENYTKPKSHIFNVTTSLTGEMIKKKTQSVCSRRSGSR